MWLFLRFDQPFLNLYGSGVGLQDIKQINLLNKESDKKLDNFKNRFHCTSLCWAVNSESPLAHTLTV